MEQIENILKNRKIKKGNTVVYSSANPDGKIVVIKEENRLKVKCSICEDTGVIKLRYNDGTSKVKLCQCLKKKDEIIKIENNFKHAKIPKRYELYTIDNLTIESRHKEFVKKNINQSLYIYGPCGCGKTATAIAILRELLQKGMVGLYITTPDLLDEIRSGWRDKSYKPSDVLTTAKEVDVLVLDDIGVEKVSDWTTEKLFQMINYRYNEIKQTIFTSNYWYDELENRIGERNVWRIAEMCQVLYLDTKNFRDKKRLEK